MGGAGEEAGEDTPRVGQCGGGDCQRLASLVGALAENVNCAAKLKESNTKDRKFEDVVKSVEQATVLVLVY